MLGSRARQCAVIVAAVTLATACGGGDTETAGDVVLRTYGDIPIDADTVVAPTTTAAAAEAAPTTEQPPDTEAEDEQAGAVDATDAQPDEAAAEAVEATTSTTLPQQEQSAGEALFEAVAVFQSCLDAEGYDFIGIPFTDNTDPEAPVNQQPYIDALIGCAARSQIQERLAEADEAQADLTPEEIEEQNRGYVAFRDCMIGRGWTIPEPTPDENGLLFPGFAATTQWQGPPGEDITQTDDVGECTNSAGIDPGEDL